jgi:hypothetical protein
MDELVEPADFSVPGFFLIEEGKFRLVEFFKEFAPGEHVQRFVLGIEIQPQNSGIAGVFQIGNGGWFSAPRFRPVTDGVVVLRDFRFRHGVSLL